MNDSNVRCVVGLAALVVFAALNLARAEAVPQREEFLLSPVTVIGTREQIAFLPGSGDLVDLEDIRRHGYDDINRALRRVPGVYVREEDGFGLFPNISLRGVDPGRSTKVTMMEDGVLIAPAPYSAPAVYNAPAVGRMSGVEVLKGSSQIKYGPQTSGGVINYLSTPIPLDREIYARTLYGTDSEWRNHLYMGETIDSPAGRFGYLVELYGRRNDGFKSIDPAPDFLDADRTGFHRIDPMLKLSWEPTTDRYQRLELKLGYTEVDAYETYMGLSDEDFARDPYRRYTASRFDKIDTRHTRSYLRHHIEFTPDLRLTSTAYYNRFNRDWFRQRVSTATMSDPASLAVLRGEAAGELPFRSNQRDYYAGGVETVMNVTTEIGATEHDVDVGVRLHRDRVKRFQRDDVFVFADNGAVTDRIIGAPGSGGNRREVAEAVALYAQDAVRYNRWTFVPGIRYEYIDYAYQDFDTTGADPRRVVGEGDTTLNVWAPGLGLIYALDERASLFGGVYRGFSVPGPRAAARDGMNEETSIGYELGGRFDNREGFSTELVFFLTDFSDLVVPDLIGVGGVEEGTQNAGDIRAYGLEFKLAYDLGVARNWGLSNPYYLAFTWTHAELRGDAVTRQDDSLFAGGVKGNRVPYIPEFQGLIGTGVENGRWGMFMDVIFVDGSYTTASNVRSPFDPEGNPNIAFGRTDSYVVVDASGYLQLKENVRLVGNIHNLFDREYMVSRHPAGPRPGKPFTALAGLEMRF